MTPEQVQAILWFILMAAALVTGVRTALRAWRADQRRRRNRENGVLRMLTTARLRRTVLGALAAAAAFLIVPVAYLSAATNERMRWVGTLGLIMSAFWAVRNIVEDFDDGAIEHHVREQEAGR